MDINDIKLGDKTLKELMDVEEKLSKLQINIDQEEQSINKDVEKLIDEKIKSILHRSHLKIPVGNVYTNNIFPFLKMFTIIQHDEYKLKFKLHINYQGEWYFVNAGTIADLPVWEKLFDVEFIIKKRFTVYKDNDEQGVSDGCL